MSTGGKTNKEKQQKRWRSWREYNTFTLCSLPVNNKGSLNCKCNLSITPYCCEFCVIYLVKMRINKAWALGIAIKTQKGCSGKHNYRASTFKFIISLMKDKWLPGWKQVSKTIWLLKNYSQKAPMKLKPLQWYYCTAFLNWIYKLVRICISKRCVLAPGKTGGKKKQQFSRFSTETAKWPI